jgi:hypothetical protein
MQFLLRKMSIAVVLNIMSASHVLFYFTAFLAICDLVASISSADRVAHLACSSLLCILAATFGMLYKESHKNIIARGKAAKESED